MIEADFSNCREYDQGEYDSRSVLFKLAVRVARLASPVL